jgi:TatD DNase family protein
MGSIPGVNVIISGSMEKIIDTHAHLDEYRGLETIIAAAKTSGLVAIIAVGSDTTSNIQVINIADAYPGFVFPALGLHPWNINMTTLDHDLEFINNHASKAIAIGEIGLDYHKKVLTVNNKDTQKQVLSELLKIAVKYKKTVLLHSRYAWKDCFVSVNLAGIESAVFHWYTGPSSVLSDILTHGYYISATPAIEYHSEHRRAVKETPLDRILLETDSPVTYAQGREGEFQAQPSDTRRSLEGTARIKEITASELAKISTSNAVQLFGLPISYDRE